MYAKSTLADGDDAGAVIVLRQIYTEDPSSSFADDAMFEHAGILDKNDSLEEAAAMYRDLYERYPESPSGEESLFRRAEILYRLKKWHEAREAFYALRTAYPDGSLLDAALYWGGMASLKAGESYGAVLLWEKLVREETKPEDIHGFFQAQGNIQQGIVSFDLGQNDIAHLFHDFAPGVIGLVDPVTESHEPERVFFVPGPGDALVNGHPVFVDLFEHLDHCLVGPAVKRSPQCADARGDG